LQSRGNVSADDEDIAPMSDISYDPGFQSDFWDDVSSDTGDLMIMDDIS
jgi:hypothetical protein